MFSFASIKLSSFFGSIFLAEEALFSLSNAIGIIWLKLIVLFFLSWRINFFLFSASFVFVFWICKAKSKLSFLFCLVSQDIFDFFLSDSKCFIRFSRVFTFKSSFFLSRSKLWIWNSEDGIVLFWEGFCDDLDWEIKLLFSVHRNRSVGKWFCLDIK
ncbi:unnamed protein product [Blepharisma stoltei]|uniref:Uncharacterized protein n=1 Tax=Blepharisma stoltei TaxID=1481888 RepID=A0AAU9IJD3_9CILI|nr:unnamed protein product [Blepharisma stoltei]